MQGVTVMSREEIVATTAAVAKTFGADIAHEVCCIYLAELPMLIEPLHWWRRTARYLKGAIQDKQNVRSARRYWLEAKWAMRRVITTPEQYAGCWELIERVPAEVSLQLVRLDGIRGNHLKLRAQRDVLRQHALRYARLAGLLLLLVPSVATAQSWTCNPTLGSGQPSQCTTTFDSRTLTDGQHTITVRAYNAAGAMVEDSVTVTVDNTGPVVVITRPTPQATYKAEGVTPAGSAIDVTTAVQTVTATLDGFAMPVTRNGAAWSMAPITKKGGHTLIVTARDGAGNLTSRIVTFKIVGGK
jgi:hypothetical protein